MWLNIVQLSQSSAKYSLKQTIWYDIVSMFLYVYFVFGGIFARTQVSFEANGRTFVIFL